MACLLRIGWNIIAVPVSAKNGENIDQLLEMVLLTADIMELKANPDRQAKGTIVEAKAAKQVQLLLCWFKGNSKCRKFNYTGTIVGRVQYGK